VSSNPTDLHALQAGQVVTLSTGYLGTCHKKVYRVPTTVVNNIKVKIININRKNGAIT
jgi:hypothetical protein